MVINCIFDADDNTLRAEDYYCISQDDNNSSVISVACRGIDAEDGWEFYLEFRCFDRRGVPTSAYTSPKLTLGESGRILFEIPDCLTLHPGYVAAQVVAGALMQAFCIQHIAAAVARPEEAEIARKGGTARDGRAQRGGQASLHAAHDA